MEVTTFYDKEGEPKFPSIPTKEGYKFAGWNLYTNESGDLVYKAKWEKEVVIPDEPNKQEPEHKEVEKVEGRVQTDVHTSTGLLSTMMIGAQVVLGFLARKRKD